MEEYSNIPAFIKLTHTVVGDNGGDNDAIDVANFIKRLASLHLFMYAFHMSTRMYANPISMAIRASIKGLGWVGPTICNEFNTKNKKAIPKMISKIPTMTFTFASERSCCNPCFMMQYAGPIVTACEVFEMNQRSNANIHC